MRTVKVVVIGASGVGKSSLRNQYISGRFTTGYRATIGADFITKSLPHFSSPEESVTLQIWDTAGQERFSSLSSAFFRGADAAILMFDVNEPATLQALVKWWAEFRDKAPVLDEDIQDFCCVIVGNKIDIAASVNRVTEGDATTLMHELIPPPVPTLPPIIDVQPESNDTDDHPELLTPIALPDSTATKSIDILVRYHRRSISKSRSHSRSTLFRGGTFGTMTTTHTVYHTPASSVFDVFESALSSPMRNAASISTTSAASSPRTLSLSPTRTPRRRRLSVSSVSTAPTITPSLFMRERGVVSAPHLPTADSIPPAPEQGARLFFTSAKTGEGVADVFEYIARRVIVRREYEEAMDACTLHIQDADDTIRLTRTHSDRRVLGSCCGS